MLKKILIIYASLFCMALKGQSDMAASQRNYYSDRFYDGKFLYGVGLTLKVDLVKSFFAYYRLSLTGGVGVPFGREINASYNIVALYYFAELDIFRGGVGAPSLSRNNQKILFELRQSFLTSVGTPAIDKRYNFTRPVVQFISNSSHPIYDPFNKSLTVGTTFVNGLNIKRSQRVGIITLGYNRFLFSYLNDGPPFNSDWLPFGDGFDRWWTGSGQVGWYDVTNPLTRCIELKYDKFTGLQPYAYEMATSLKLKYIPYNSREIQLQNRTRLELSVSTSKGVGLSYNIYDMPLLDIQHYIHQKSHFSFHSTPLKWRGALGMFYTNTFLIN